jgi:DNA-binding transcriptional regulator LsrR (DeoR family)
MTEMSPRQRLLREVVDTHRQNKIDAEQRKQEFKQLLLRTVHSGVTRQEIADATGIGARTIGSMLKR